MASTIAPPAASTVPVEAFLARPAENTYKQILKSSALVGGSQIVNIVIGMLRTKAMALLLGPSGFGLFGLYNSISDVAQTVAGLGVNSSGVRQIAEAVASADEQRVAKTASVLRWTSTALGIAGAVMVALFSRQISTLTFGNDHQAIAISFLSVVVALRLVSAGQAALIQGTRRIADLAKMSVFGAIFGVVFGVPLVYFLREKGIVLSLIGVALATILTSWVYSRKIKTLRTRLNTAQMVSETIPLLKLGLAFMVTTLMSIGSAYVIRILVLRTLGFAATGLYQSAWTLGGLYVSFVLQAMGADFYPRLTAVSNDDEQCNRLVNEQALVGLLIAGPGAIATLTFAPLVITLFYSAKFHAAVGILRWICLGATLQVITWPMGFISLAKGRSKVFFWCDLAWTVVYLGLAWSCIKLFGLNGTGIAFFCSYVFHAAMTYPVARWLSGFRWSGENRRNGVMLIACIAAVFCASYLLPFYAAASFGAIAAILSALYSLRMFLTLISPENVPPLLRKLLPRFVAVLA